MGNAYKVFESFIFSDEIVLRLFVEGGRQYAHEIQMDDTFQLVYEQRKRGRDTTVVQLF